MKNKLSFLLLYLCFNLSLHSQEILHSKNYKGIYRIVYLSDTLAFENMTKPKWIKELNLYDSSLLLKIDSVTISFERNGYDFIDYRLRKYRNKRVIAIKLIPMAPALSRNPPESWQKIYRLVINAITKDAIILNFKNIKEKPGEYSEYYGELRIIAIRVKP
jgi:hypothetical protein